MKIFGQGRSNLQTQLTFIFLVLLSIAIGAMVLANLPVWRDKFEATVDEREELYIEQQAIAVQDFVDHVEQDVRFLGQLTSVQDLATLLLDPEAERVQVLRQRNAVEQDFLAFSNTWHIYDQVRFLDASGQEIIRIDFDGESAQLASQNSLVSLADRDYFISTISQPKQELFVSRLQLKREGTPPAIVGNISDGTAIPTIYYGIPIYANSPDGEEVLAGVVIANIFAQHLLDLIQPNADDATAFLIDQNGYYLKHSKEPHLAFGFELAIDAVGGIANARAQNQFSESVMTQLLASINVEHIVIGDEFIHATRITPPSANYFWILGNVRKQSATLAPVLDTVNVIALSTAVILVVGAMIAVVAIRYSLQPLKNLANVASQIAGGNRSLRAPYTERSDDIGTLSHAINAITDQLNQSIKDFEERINIATRDLQALVEVNLQTSSLLESERLLQSVANLIKEHFGLYHAQFYISHEDKLSLVAGAGYIGRQMIAQRHFIELQHPRNIIARAGREQKTFVIDDAATSPDFSPNKLLPNTASEIAIPLVARNQFIGVMNLHSEQPHSFDDRFIAILEVLAQQVSNAVLNARLFEIASRASRHEHVITEITSAVQQANSVEDILKIATRELGRALRVPHTVIEVQLKDSDS